MQNEYFCCMIILEGTLISEEIRDVHFSCDLQNCQGACCVEGDAGAPLEEEEISLLEDHLPALSAFMTPGGILTVKETGVFDYDADGKFVTPLVNGKECVYVFFEEGIARCAIEKAFRKKAIPFPKPLSCHLYPIRIRNSRKIDAVNYHEWHICKSALERGRKEQLPLYRFLQDALVRKYSRPWFDRLVKLLN